MNTNLSLCEALLVGISYSVSADIADTLATWDGSFG